MSAPPPPPPPPKCAQCGAPTASLSEENDTCWYCRCLNDEKRIAYRCNGCGFMLMMSRTDTCTDPPEDDDCDQCGLNAGFTRVKYMVPVLEGNGGGRNAAARTVAAATAVVRAAEAYKHLDAINYIADGAAGAPITQKGAAHLTRERVDGVRECLLHLTGVSDPGDNDAERAEVRRRLEDAARIGRRMEECGNREQGHRLEDDHCTDCGKPRWDMTDEEREAAAPS